MPIHKIIDDIVSYIAKEWSQDELNSCSDFDRIAKELKNLYPRMGVAVVKIGAVLALLNARDVVSIYDTYHPLDLLWSGYVEEVPDKYKSCFCFTMEHNDAGYQLYV